MASPKTRVARQQEETGWKQERESERLSYILLQGAADL